MHKERAQGDNIIVDVIAEYDDIDEGQDVLGSTKACFAWRKEGGLWEQGVLLWVSNHAVQRLRNLEADTS